MSEHYLAFTTGPLFRTITRARKTRELWAASYVFSRLMRRILGQLNEDQVLLPNIKEADLDASPHGAGIWPDRCILQLADEQLPDVKGIIEEAIKDLAGDLNVRPKDLEPLFSVQALHADWRTDDIEKNATGEESDLAPVHRINRLLDNLELSAPYQPVERVSLNRILGEQIHDLYDTAGHTKGGEVFIQLSDNTVRLPSLPEIALREIAKHPDHGETYKKIVKIKIDEKIVAIRSKEGRAKDLDDQKTNEAFYEDLKEALPEHTIRFRHKYVAIVVADGDKLGETITAISQHQAGGTTISDFSSELQEFARKAVEEIATYGGLPVYAGGDDLLFVAPVATAEENIFGLCQSLDKLFQSVMTQSGVSLSFGLSISYYKHPLGEALATAYELEKRAKKFNIFYQADNKDKPEKDWKPKHKKNALCFRVQKHSGAQFGSTLWLGGESFTSLSALLQADEQFDQTFLTSVMHRLQTLPSLLADAVRGGRIASFREHHFNEGGRHDKEYLTEVMKLAGEIFADYGDLLDPAVRKKMEKDPLYKKRAAEFLDLHHTNILFSALRLKQFLIQADHD